jgi:hypothetical protein
MSAAPRTGAPALPAWPGPTSSLPLHRWWRLDWRFLIPSSEWEVIGCAGEVDEALREALPLVASRIEDVASDSDRVGRAGTCDLVVLVQPTRTELRSAVTALRPGGWMYVEVRRTVALRGPRSLMGWRRACVRSGLEDVAAHWHSPDLAGTTRMVAVEAGTAIRAVTGGPRTTRSRLRGAALEVLLRLRLLSAVVPAGSVVGRRPHGSA